MKDHRRIVTLITAAKAINKTSKEFPPLGLPAITALYLVYYLQPISSPKVLSKLCYLNLSKTRQAHDYVINKLASLGYIVNSSGQYSITPLGLSYLRTLETNLRKARIDK